MGNVPNLGPEVIKGTAISTGVFFGFRRLTSRILIKNLSPDEDLSYHFLLISTDSEYTTIPAGPDGVAADARPETIVDSVMGINVKAPAGQTIAFEAVAMFDYLR